MPTGHCNHRDHRPVSAWPVVLLCVAVAAGGGICAAVRSLAVALLVVAALTGLAALAFLLWHRPHAEGHVPAAQLPAPNRRHFAAQVMPVHGQPARALTGQLALPAPTRED